ncbi:MAG TPA: DUF4785 family protein [Thermoanaerobaculia bacterium]|nr:DUF4785 family protein [Thermoanaerobaculia bacterium]
MRTSLLATTAGIALSLAAAVQAQTRFTASAPAGADLVSRALVAPPAGPSLNNSREPVAFAWALPSDQALTTHLRPQPTESREHWLRITGAELERGVPLLTTAPGALVRLSPVGAKSAPALDPAALVLVDPRGQSLARGTGFDLIAPGADLEAAGLAVPAGTVAVRLSSELGSGRFTLRLPGLASGQELVLHVFDRASTVVLSLAADRFSYLDGERLKVRLEAQDGAAPLALASATGFVTSPAGRSWPLQFKPGSQGLSATLALDAREPVVASGAGAGLWEIQVAASGHGTAGDFLRNARTSFAVALPTARLAGGASARSGDAGLTLTIPVETAAPGRYEVRATLFGHDAQGASKPIAVADSAAWLEAGNGKLELLFPAGLLAGSGLAAPYELRQLELIDQGRLAVLHRQDVGGTIQP